VGGLTVAGRDPARAREIAELIAERFERPAEHLAWQDELAVSEGIDAVVHATTLGREDADATVPIALDSLRNGLILADMTANPPDTWLIRQAAERGCTTLDGLGMYVEQSAVAIELWTGTSPDRSVMRDAIEEFLEV
jgi:shikimate dehydrogenase